MFGPKKRDLNVLAIISTSLLTDKTRNHLMASASGSERSGYEGSSSYSELLDSTERIAVVAAEIYDALEHQAS